ncbi:MAG: 23S rRNA (uracil(1939)-C(5))-methyltransferase RlmD [Desulfuromonadaceae bacterium]|nr:23S rRNA (uracil(1939)-C(5))-methyltransferase RlmD [Desulfuromonadaceae bacterium]
MTLPTATIDKLAFGGNGVCRIDGKVCFVPFSCPGDEVSLYVTTQKKSYSVASIADISTPSPSRTAAECSIFGLCGGCHWQHINYSTQLEGKQKIVEDTLWRGARVPAESISEIVASPLEFGYRSRLQFKTSVQNGELRIGFFRQGSHEVVDAPHGCLVAVPVINEVLTRFRRILMSFPEVKSIVQLSIDSGDCGVIVVLHHTGMLTLDAVRYLADKSDEFGPCTGLFLKSDSHSRCEKVWGNSEISYRLNRKDAGDGPVILTYPPGSFAQVNLLQNSSMLSVVRRLGAFETTEHLLDLYCGNGNFSIPLAVEVASVVGVEGNAESIRAAESNKSVNKVANVLFFCDDVAAGVRRLVSQKRWFDTILLDPPRAGAGDAIAGIICLKPNKIIYVSCDPNTLARDCGLLINNGYRVVETVPLDMFPQTFHVESVTLLCR